MRSESKRYKKQKKENKTWKIRLKIVKIKFKNVRLKILKTKLENIKVQKFFLKNNKKKYL